MEEKTERKAGKKTEKKPEREHEGAMRRRIPVGKLAPALTAAMILIMIPVKTIHPMTKIIAQMMIPTTAMILISPTTVKNSPVKIL